MKKMNSQGEEMSACRKLDAGKRFAAFLSCALMGVSALATDYTFPTKNGDLASPADWEMSSIPGPSDLVVIDTQGRGYTISKDVTFGNLQVTATGESVITASGVTVKVNALSYPFRMIDSSTARYVHLDGGTWDANGVEFKGMSKNSWLYLQNGAVLTNVTTCWLSSLAYNAVRFYLTDASRIHCSEFRMINMTSSGNGKLSVASGSKVKVDGTFFTETGTAAYATDKKTVTIVSGAGSELTCASYLIGFKASGHTLQIADGGRFSADNLRIGYADAGYGYRVLVDGGTLVAKDYIQIHDSSVADPGTGIAATNATIEAGVFTNLCKASICDFQNTAFTVTGGFQLFPSGTGSATVRFGGAKGTQLNAMDYFGYSTANGGYSLIVDDHFALTNNSYMKMMRMSSQGTIRVSNGATFRSSNLIHVGFNDVDASVSNRIEVLSGGAIEVDSFRLMGRGNLLWVSNATVYAANASDGLLLGYIGPNARVTSQGTRVVVEGETPRLVSVGSLWLYGDVNVRIRIPATGYAYADGVKAPFEAKGVNFQTTATLDVDYADYLAAGGGDATLMSFSTDVSQTSRGDVTFAEWVRSQGKRMKLPAGCKLKLVTDESGSRVVFHAGPPSGMMLLVR